MVGPGQNRDAKNKFIYEIRFIHGFHFDPVRHNSTITLCQCPQCQKRQSRLSHRWPECSNSQIVLLVRREWKHTRTRQAQSNKIFKNIQNQLHCAATDLCCYLDGMLRCVHPSFDKQPQAKDSVYTDYNAWSTGGSLLMQLVFEMSHNVQKTQAKAEKM